MSLSSRDSVGIMARMSPPWWTAAAWLTTAFLVQLTIFPFVALRGAQPSAVLVAVMWYSIRSDPRRAVVVGLIAGFIEDAIAGTTGGAFTVGTALAAILGALASRGFFADSIPIVAGVTFVATIVRSVAFWTVMAIQGFPPGLARIHLHQSLWQAFLNASLAALLVIGVRRFSRSSNV